MGIKNVPEKVAFIASAKRITTNHLDELSSELSIISDDGIIRAIFRNRVIGHLSYTSDGPEAHLGDLCLRKERYGLDRIVAIIFGRFSQRYRESPFKGKGIGSFLMQHFLTHCERAGIRKITGFVTKEDAAATPYLLSWYERIGFNISQYEGNEWPEGTLYIFKNVTVSINAERPMENCL